MTDPHDPDLHAVDEAARAASRGLHDHVAPARRPRAGPRRAARRRAAAATRPAPGGGRRRRAVHRLGGRARGRAGRRRALAPRARRGRQQAPGAGARRPHPARSERRPRLDPAARHRRAERRPARRRHRHREQPGLRPGRAGRHRPVRHARPAARSASSGPASTAATSARCSTPTPTTTGWPPAPSRCSGSSRRRPPARSTAPLEAERCIVAMGALGDYDRSGGFGVAFAGGGEPIDIPTITRRRPPRAWPTATSCTSRARGSSPTRPCMLSVCSIDPAGCWSTGEPIELDSEDVQATSSSADEYGGGYAFTGLLADADGRVSGDVPVWRFLPGPTPGSYIDCAVSACRLRVTAEVGYSPGSRDPRLRARRRGAAAAGRRGRPHPGPRAGRRDRGPRGRASSRGRTSTWSSAPHRPATRAASSGAPVTGATSRSTTTAASRSCSRCPTLATWASGGRRDGHHDHVRRRTAGAPLRRSPPATGCDGVELVCSIRVETYQDGDGGRPAAVRRRSPWWSPSAASRPPA